MEMYLVFLFISVIQLISAGVGTVPTLQAGNEIKNDNTSAEDIFPETTTLKPEEINFVPLEENIPYKWSKILWPTKKIPVDAVLGGIDSPYGCGMVYVGRAMYEENLLPAKICGSDGRAFVSYNGSEIMLNESEILRSRHAYWKPVIEGGIPKNAFHVGLNIHGETFYIGRGFVNTLLTPGKVDKNSKKLLMTYDQKVYNTFKYEILIISSACV